MSWCDMNYHVQNVAIWVMIVVLAVLVAATVKRGKAPSEPDARPESPEQILERRYAAGEIDRETYQRMLADLRRDPGAPVRKEVV